MTALLVLSLLIVSGVVTVVVGRAIGVADRREPRRLPTGLPVFDATVAATGFEHVIDLDLMQFANPERDVRTVPLPGDELFIRRLTRGRR